MQTREEYLEHAKAQLEALNERIVELENKTSQVSKGIRDRFDEELRELRQSQKVAESRMQELRTATDHAWEDVKVGVELAWDALAQSVSNASDRYK